MDCYTKLKCPGCQSGCGGPGCGTDMGFQMPMGPGPVIRPEMPMGAGPAAGRENTRWQERSMSPQAPSGRGSSMGPQMPMGPGPVMEPQMPSGRGASMGSQIPMGPGPAMSPEMPVNWGDSMSSDATMGARNNRNSGTAMNPQMNSEMPSGSRTTTEMPMTGGPVMNPGGGVGSMPSETIDQYPIAMAYVPWQTWQQIYPLERGLKRGTIFAELDKPFVMGRCQ